MNCAPQIFEDLFTHEFPVLRTFLGDSRPSVKGHQPLGVNLYEDEQAYVAEVPVPGIQIENIQISKEKGGISIVTKKEEERKDVKYHYKSASNYSYWIPLPTGKIDETLAPEAVCKDGVLKITFLKMKSMKPLKIEVKKG